MLQVSYIDGPLAGMTSEVPLASATITAKVGPTITVYVRQGQSTRYCLASQTTQAVVVAKAAPRRGKVTVLPDSRPRTRKAPMKRARSS